MKDLRAGRQARDRASTWIAVGPIVAAAAARSLRDALKRACARLRSSWPGAPQRRRRGSLSLDRTAEIRRRRRQPRDRRPAGQRPDRVDGAGEVVADDERAVARVQELERAEDDLVVGHGLSAEATTRTRTSPQHGFDSSAISSSPALRADRSPALPSPSSALARRRAEGSAAYCSTNGARIRSSRAGDHRQHQPRGTSDHRELDGVVVARREREGAYAARTSARRRLATPSSFSGSNVLMP